MALNLAGALSRFWWTRSHFEEGQRHAHGRLHSGLTGRENEVAAHVAEGLTNRQIAAELHVAERTVAAHIEHILNKLGFVSRTQIAAWAAANNRAVLLSAI